MEKSEGTGVEFRRHPEEEFKKGGWLFKFIKRGKNAIMFEVIDPEGVMGAMREVWHIRTRPATVIRAKGKEVHVPARELAPSNEDYPTWAHQLIAYHYEDGEEGMIRTAEKIFNEYEIGVRPKLIEHLHVSDEPIIKGEFK